MIALDDGAQGVHQPEDQGPRVKNQQAVEFNQRKAI
jgi:hypothetical protein